MHLSKTIRNKNRMLSAGRSSCDLPLLLHGSEGQRWDESRGKLSPAAGRCLSGCVVGKLFLTLSLGTWWWVLLGRVVGEMRPWFYLVKLWVVISRCFTGLRRCMNCSSVGDVLWTNQGCFQVYWRLNSNHPPSVLTGASCFSLPTSVCC